MYLKSVDNVITLGKLIGLLFLFCLPLLSIFFLKTKRNDLARPVMGNIFLVNHIPQNWGVTRNKSILEDHITNFIYKQKKDVHSMIARWWITRSSVTPLLIFFFFSWQCERVLERFCWNVLNGTEWLKPV